MKLTDILRELNLPKNTWAPVPSNEIKDFEQNIFQLIQTAYSPIGGNPKFRTPSDVVNPRNEYEVIDLDNDPDIDAVSVTKQTPSGTKLVGSGHDGSSEAKRVVVHHKIDLLKHQGFFIEASGRVKDILIAKGIEVVTDKDTVVKALNGKPIEWHGDGTYTREIGGNKFEKTMFGKPAT